MYFPFIVFGFYVHAEVKAGPARLGLMPSLFIMAKQLAANTATLRRVGLFFALGAKRKPSTDFLNASYRSCTSLSCQISATTCGRNTSNQNKTALSSGICRIGAWKRNTVDSKAVSHSEHCNNLRLVIFLISVSPKIQRRYLPHREKYVSGAGDTIYNAGIRTALHKLFKAFVSK